MMRAIVSKIDNDGSVSVYETLIKDYKDYYKHLECDTFDVVRVEWKGVDISLFVDDEGLLKSGNLGRDVKTYDDIVARVFGSIVIIGGVDEEGETLPLPDDIQIEDVVKFISSPKYQVR